MSFGAIFLLALGLSMDAMAVAAARGLATPRILPRHVLLVAGFFGGFQALMPMVGWLVGVLRVVVGRSVSFFVGWLLVGSLVAWLLGWLLGRLTHVEGRLAQVAGF